MRRTRSIGILAETYSLWERRSPLTPRHVEHLVRRRGVDVFVQPSTRRIFPDGEFLRAGATITNNLGDANVVLGVKQPALGSLLPSKSFCFFSHTIKGQDENMPLLDEILQKRCRLIDYECIREGGGGSTARLIAFGEFAGKAGLVNGLRGLGLRLLHLGFSTPFLSVGPTHSYLDYSDACRALRAVGQQITEHGLPAEFAPLTVTIAGTGNVSKGAVDALSALGDGVVRWVSSEELPGLSALQGTDGPHRHVVHACVVGTEHFVAAPADGRPLDRTHYYANPHEYVPTFHERIVPHTTLLVPTMYWDPRFPRLLTIDQLSDLRGGGNARLLAVADLTCDVGGAVETLVRTSSIDHPFYVYDVERRAESRDGLRGDGVLMLGVDILPSELPRESSHHFGEALLPFVEALSAARSDGTPLPPELASATIADDGELAPAYRYIESMRRARERETAQVESATRGRSRLAPLRARALEGSTVLSLHGHLFDSGYINAALDIVERAGGEFDILEVNVRPNSESGASAEERLSLRVESNALLQLTLPEGRTALDGVIAELRDLASSLPDAAAGLVELPDFCGAEMLSREPADTVRIVSASDGEAEGLCASLRRNNCVPARYDASEGSADWAALTELLQGSDAALSLLPATMHRAVAVACIDAQTPLVTASYVAPDVAALHDDALQRGVPILCEMGLDPGLDHMSAAATIASVHARGGRVVTFRSVCGGLPSPEDAASNPFAYKFSWSPAGVLAATRNGAQWRSEGEVVRIDASELLQSARPLDDGLTQLGRSFHLEVLPNRDALPYADLYGIDGEASTFFRGTLRYRGWSEVMAALGALGLTDGATPVPHGVSTWEELLPRLGVPLSSAQCESAEVARGVDALRWLGAMGGEIDGGSGVGTPLAGAENGVTGALCALLESRLRYEPHERDLVLMEHTLGVAYDHGRREAEQVISSSLVAYGDAHGGTTAMAKSVGLTAAVGVHRLMEPSTPAVRHLAGVLRPTEKQVWEYCLPRLEAEGLRFREGRRVV